MTHTCPVASCAIQCPDHILMCKQHWFMLPKPLRESIYATYTPRQTLSTASDAYRKNLREALNYLQDKAPAPGGVEMSAFTVWQPWASLIAIGAKPMEFRSHARASAHTGKRVAIHAGKRPARKDEIRNLLLELHSSFWRGTGLVRDPAIKLLTKALMAPATLPTGAVVCTAVMGAPIRNDDVERALGLPVTNDSDRDEHTNWAWPLGDVRAIDPPIPMRGAQGFFKVTVPQEAAL